MLKPVSIVCTRSFSHALKIEAQDNSITIFDRDFLWVSYRDDPSLTETVSNNLHPFVFTSIHAVKAVASLIKKHGVELKNNSCYCISGNTLLCAQQNGFIPLANAKDATSLAHSIISRNENSVLHCTANFSRRELRDLLLKAGIELVVCEIYHKNILPVKVSAFDGVMFFSPSQIDAFRTVNELHPQTPAFCIGSTTAQHLADCLHKNILISSQSNERAMLEKVYEYFKKH